MVADFDAVFAELRALMLREASGMGVGHDVPGDLTMVAPWPHPRDPKKPMWFGMVRSGSSYVSFHLMPLYMNPVMLAKVPPTLERRMQGKTCFKFKTVDPDLFAELATLTQACAQAFAKPITL